jgi:hypothetical protein
MVIFYGMFCPIKVHIELSIWVQKFYIIINGFESVTSSLLRPDR